MINTIKNLFGMGQKTNYAELIKAGAIILDVRSKAEFDNSHLKGSVNIPLGELSHSLAKIKEKNRPIITCCTSGMRSASAKTLLQTKGYTHVYNAGSCKSLQRKL